MMHVTLQSRLYIRLLGLLLGIGLVFGLSLNHYLRVLLETEVADAPGARPLAVKAGAIRFEDVRFVETVHGPGGGKRFWLYRGVRAGQRDGANLTDCGAVPPDEATAVQR